MRSVVGPLGVGEGSAVGGGVEVAVEISVRVGVTPGVGTTVQLIKKSKINKETIR
jgi:hypothetical protein